MNDAITTATASHELRMRQLQDQVDGMERQLAEILERNKDEELRLRKEKTRAEIALSGKISQYDEDMAQVTEIRFFVFHRLIEILPIKYWFVVFWI